MAQTAMTVRMDNQQKAQFDKLCEQFGMSANTAINIFVKAVIRANSTSKCKITKCFCKSTPLVLRNSISFLVSH